MNQRIIGKGEKALRRSDIISAVVLIVLGVITIFVIIPDQISGSSDYGIAPDVFPLTLIWIFTILCIILFLNRLWSKKKNKETQSIKANIGWGFISLASLFLISSFVLFKYLGFIYGGIYTVAVVMLVMGEYRHKIRLILVTILAPGLIYSHTYVVSARNTPIVPRL